MAARVPCPPSAALTASSAVRASRSRTCQRGEPDLARGALKRYRSPLMLQFPDRSLIARDNGDRATPRGGDMGDLDEGELRLPCGRSAAGNRATTARMCFAR